ncbi:MAG: hypothetical protein Q8941_00545 [Bacteroidota bacterium]|nr:hypothetical protein [Bacteroidota bacterium]
MRRFSFIITLMVVISCKNRKEETIFKSWKSYPPPEQYTAQQYNQEFQDWIVYKVEDSIKVTLDRIDAEKQFPFKIETNNDAYSKFGGHKSFIATDDGYLAGFFRGEFGGNLWWFSKDGKESYEIGEYQLVGFAKRDNKIYAIEGLAHLGLSGGNLLEIIKENNKWVAKKYLDLREAPLGIDVDSRDNIIVMTSTKILAIDNTKKIDTLVYRGFWYPYLYPTSLVIKNNILYSGMRRGVYKYNLDSGNEEWLMK